MSEISKDPTRKAIKTKIGMRFWGYKTRRELESENIIDGLTGILNKKGWDQKVANVKGATYIEIDLDDLKIINDSKGHAEGDKVIAKFGEILKSTIRVSDVAARIGGDEFAICLPRTSVRDSENLKERIINAAGNIRISIGLGRNLEEADREMYRMKRLHKNG